MGHLECELLGRNYTGRLSMESHNCLLSSARLLLLSINQSQSFLLSSCRLWNLDMFSILASEEEDVVHG